MQESTGGTPIPPGVMSVKKIADVTEDII